jgi:hypothetical protein
MNEPTTLEGFRQVAEALRQLAAVVDALSSAQLPQPKDRAMTFREIANLMGRQSVSSVYSAVDSGQLRARVLGGDGVILLSDFHDYLSRLPLRGPRQPRRRRPRRSPGADVATTHQEQAR